MKRGELIALSIHLGSLSRTNCIFVNTKQPAPYRSRLSKAISREQLGWLVGWNLGSRFIAVNLIAIDAGSRCCRVYT